MIIVPERTEDWYLAFAKDHGIATEQEIDEGRVQVLHKGSIRQKRITPGLISLAKPIVLPDEKDEDAGFERLEILQKSYRNRLLGVSECVALQEAGLGKEVNIWGTMTTFDALGPLLTFDGTKFRVTKGGSTGGVESYVFGIRLERKTREFFKVVSSHASFTPRAQANTFALVY